VNLNTQTGKYHEEISMISLYYNMMVCQGKIET